MEGPERVVAVLLALGDPGPTLVHVCVPEMTNKITHSLLSSATIEKAGPEIDPDDVGPEPSIQTLNILLEDCNNETKLY